MPATPDQSPGILNRLKAQGDIWVAAGLFGLLVIMVVPLPPGVMDMLLALSISVALLTMLVTFYVNEPVHFSVFPTLLLVATLFRLSLNVATTRLILLNGAEGTHAAGNIIMSFGKVVVGGNYVVGLVVFAILVIINFMVITKGAGRIAEVSARFTLDAMPGKQMAVDAELNAGLIDEQGARARRGAIHREADFYGAMDGASKFIRGDAIAGILITLINIVGGIIVGVFQSSLTLGAAVQNYTILTIGDGLVGQIPALVISAAAGVLVTRVPDETSRPLHGQLGAQLLGEPRIMALLAACLLGFAFMPGLRLPFVVLGLVALVVAWQARSRAGALERRPEAEEGEEGHSETSLKALLHLEPLAVELGVDMVALVEERKGGTLVERIQRVRQQFVQDQGLVVPTVHLRDNLALEGGEYRILLRGEEVARGKVIPRQCLAIDPGDTSGRVKGIPTKDPVFALDAVWIPESSRLQAQAYGFTVVDIPTILTTHLTEALNANGHELFGRQELADILENVTEHNPRLVEELIPDILSRGAVLRVFRNLLREGVAIRDSDGILEALAEHAHRSRDVDVLTDLVRQRLARHITARFTDPQGVLRYIALAPDAEEALTSALQAGEDGSSRLVLEPRIMERLMGRLAELSRRFKGEDQVVLICPPLVRGPFRRLSEKLLPKVPVLSPGELIPSVRLERAGLLSLATESTASGRGRTAPPDPQRITA